MFSAFLLVTPLPPRMAIALSSPCGIYELDAVKVAGVSTTVFPFPVEDGDMDNLYFRLGQMKKMAYILCLMCIAA